MGQKDKEKGMRVRSSNIFGKRVMWGCFPFDYRVHRVSLNESYVELVCNIYN